MRRLVLEDPFARSAIWSRNLAVFAFFVALIGVVLSRKGLDPQAALAIVGAALGLAALAMVCALLAFGVIWQTGYRGIGLALGGLILAGLLFVYPAYIAVQARTVPPLSDVSTDLDDPPQFLSTEPAVAARKGWTPPSKMSAADRAAEARLYPDLQTLALDADVSDVVDAIHKLIKRRHWTIVDEVVPTDFLTGHIDAVASSVVMGFPADVTFRIRALGGKTQIDVRSVSRAGWQEQRGSNAARVDSLMNDIEDAINES
jgi:uncharacterized protein (DUF1499 family)